MYSDLGGKFVFFLASTPLNFPSRYRERNNHLPFFVFVDEDETTTALEEGESKGTSDQKNQKRSVMTTRSDPGGKKVV